MTAKWPCPLHEGLGEGAVGSGGRPARWAARGLLEYGHEPRAVRGLPLSRGERCRSSHLGAGVAFGEFAVSQNKQVVRQAGLAGVNHLEHGPAGPRSGSMIRRYIIRWNKHTVDIRLHTIVTRVNVA